MNKHFIAKFGSPKMQDKLVNDPNYDVRADVAEHGNDEHRDKLVDDPDEYVRRVVAEHGNNSHRDKLINDPDVYIRIAVARNGNDSHRLALAKMRNTSPATLNTIAHYGNTEARDAILDHHNVELGSALSTIINHVDATPEQKLIAKHIRDNVGNKYKY